MNKMLTIFVSIIVAGVVVGASLPIFASFTTSEETHTNDGVGWIRFNYDTSASEYEISLTESEDGITITNGSDTQTYSADSAEDFGTILYADTNLSVWADDDNIHVLGLVDGSPVYTEGWGDFTISRTADGVTFDIGVDSITFDTPTWAYVPWSSGSYGFFTPSEEGVVTYPADMPNAIVGGGFAGVYAYNDIYRYDGLGLVMTPTYNGDNLTGAGWAKPSVPFDPQQVTITPLDPSVIGGGDTGEITDPITPIDIDPFEPDAGLMAVPTPTYTDGEWGYDVIQVDGVDKAAIVSYSGSGGDIVVPSKVGGYDVYRFGKSDPSVNTQNQVFTNSSLSSNSTITFPEGIVEIGSYACQGASKLSGDLKLPNTLRIIGYSAFSDCTHFKHGLIIPDGVTSIGNYAFSGYGNSEYMTASLGPLVVPSSVVSVGVSAFAIGNCNSIIYATSAYNTNMLAVANTTVETSVLDLSGLGLNVGSYGIPSGFPNVQTDIGDCFGFISIVSYTTGGDPSPTQQIIALLPLVMVAGLVIMAGVMLIYKKV